MADVVMGMRLLCHGGWRRSSVRFSRLGELGIEMEGFGEGGREWRM